SDRRMRVLIRDYRKKDYATDVLSFAAEGSSGEAAFRLPPFAARAPHPGSRQLGDVVVATGVARRQARAARHSYQSELRVLALHGLLHLLGYDHEDPRDDGRMKRTEMRLRKKGGLKAGLIQRIEGARAGVGPRGH
ncbi:MAG: rRNA maturation RNase YbeY, partial [Acidobacteria bacterium]|nr:rRNA maturation RNase YbeY [Acidobacteriota bacterium]